MRNSRYLTLAVFLLLSLPGRVADASTSWPGLRGPNHSGAVPDARLFASDSDGLEIGWKRDLGAGYAVVAVDGQRLVTAFQAGAEDVVAAFDLEHGDELWRQPIGEAYAGHTGSHDGPIATPLLVDGRVYVLGPRGDLHAFDAGNGREIWGLNLVKDLEAEAPYYGFASSPLLANGVLVVEIGAGEGKAFGGFDPESGKLLWTAGTDSIRYQSPIVATIGGEAQVLVVGNKTLSALDPTDGRVIWTYEHNGDERDMGGNTIVPVPAGEDRILLMNTHPTSVMLQITQGDPYTIEELWSSGSIKSSYVQPVYRDGYLYGMNSKIFTCVDAATGETVWRSREAGDGFPTLVGDHLVIMNKPGTVRVAKAAPEGYQEIASLQVFDEHSWSAPAFANGHLYVRSMGQLARLDVVSAAVEAGSADADAQGPAWVATTAFGSFLAAVEAAEDKEAVIESYLAEQRSFPIVEDSGVVHFVYQGDGQDIGIVGDMIGYRREDPMIRVADTDLHYYSTLLEPNAAGTYGFISDFSDPMPDPRNERSAEGLFGEVSFYSMPAWRPSEYLDKAPAERRGTIETVEWQSQAKEGQTRQADIYLPVGYKADPERRYPTVYVLDGSEARKFAQLENTLDHLTGSSIEPLIAVMVRLDEEDPERDIGDGEALTAMVATELVPLIDDKYRTRTDPMQRGVVGAADAGDTALEAALKHPDLFARVGSLWPIVFEFDFDTLPLSEEQPLVIYQVWGTYHIRSPHEAWNQVVENRNLFQTLRDRGYRPAGGEVPEGFGWIIWRNYTDDMLTALFPLR